MNAISRYGALENWASGKTLFREGELPKGVYYLHDGSVSLTFAGRTLRIAEPGQILGLSAIVGGRPNDSSAITRTPAMTGYISKERFLQLLEDNPELWLTVLQMISSDISACWDSMRNLGGATSGRRLLT